MLLWSCTHTQRGRGGRERERAKGKYKAAIVSVHLAMKRYREHGGRANAFLNSHELGMSFTLKSLPLLEDVCIPIG
jgi:hypothetical protein